MDEECPNSVLAQFDVVLIPTIRRVDRALWKRLSELTQRDTVVVVGPERPTHDERDRPLGTDAATPAQAGLIRAQSIDDVEGFADDLIALLDDRPDRPPDGWVCEQAHVSCSLFVDGNDQPRVLFVANQSDEAESAELVVPDPVRLTDALTGQAIASHRALELAPRAVRMLLIDR